MQEQHRFVFIALRCVLLCAAIVVAGCSAITPQPRSAQVEERVPGDARQAYDRGAYREAARLWQLDAIDAEPSAASQLRLYAADAWLLAGDPDAAEDLFPWIERDALSGPDEALMNLLHAQLALDRDRPIEARQHLDQVGSALPETYSSRYSTLSGRVQSALGSLTTRSVQRAGELASEIGAYDADAALALVRQLESVPSSQLAALSRLAGDPERTAWFDLALVLRENLVDGNRLEGDIRQWKRRHPAIPVSESDALDLWLRYRQEFRPPARVAILLPESGGLKAAGTAIRDGIMSAYLRQPAGSKLRFYGTGDDPESVLAAYFEAVDDGADWILGPLDKAAVESLLNLAGLATPVLALNELPDRDRIPEGLAQQVFGMSLSQEQEAVAVARYMAELGHKRAVLLAPQNTWGDRIVQAFQEDFLQEDREILVAARYLPGDNDHSEMLEQALKIDESKNRKQRLQNRLGIELEFEPVRRSDVDAIFLAAAPEQGRLLTPQLRFFEAGDIPTYATSRVYTGRPDPATNQDLDGVNLPLTAWQLEHPTRGAIPPLESLRQGEFAPLFAIGMDAWNILPWLELIRRDPDFRFPGQSGTYSITAHGNLRREPNWGRFRGGVPVAVSPSGPPPRLATQAQ